MLPIARRKAFERHPLTAPAHLPRGRLLLAGWQLQDQIAAEESYSVLRKASICAKNGSRLYKAPGLGYFDALYARLIACTATPDTLSN